MGIEDFFLQNFNLQARPGVSFIFTAC